MKYIIFSILLLFIFQNGITQVQKTVFETSKGTQTATYFQTISYYKELAESHRYIAIREVGETDSGYPLQLVIVDMDEDFDFTKSREKGKTVVLINNGIHPGEPDGIDASMMLLRDYVSDLSKMKILKNIVLAVIPVYNIGGALNRNNYTRVNQDGPESYGFRGNARNLDLNRDFIKSDSKNARAFYGVFHLANPDIFIDTHVSNGADYQYSITHLATQHNKIGGEIGEYIEKEFTPWLERLMKERDTEITPYVNVFNTTPDEKGFSQFLDGPRYSTGYAALFNTLGFMIETHMLKPFDERVKATYSFLEIVLELTQKDGMRIQNMRKRMSEELIPGHLYPIRWVLDESKYVDLEFKGYEGQMIESNVTGQNRLRYDRSKPYVKTIPYYNVFVPVKEIVMPKAYIIPQGWYRVIDRLRLNNVMLEQLQKDTTLSVQRYQIVDYNTSSTPYEGHYPHSGTIVEMTTGKTKFLAGDYICFLTQPAGRYLMETLEPEAPDSFFNWNFFDTILQQKEYFSPYVFEDLAWSLLQRDDIFRVEFEEKKKSDPEFAGDGYAQLDYIYKQSKYAEVSYLRYPVCRLMD